MQYIILLRGINTGGRTIRMTDLKACLEKAGFSEVTTVLQTGNVLLEAAGTGKDKLKARVEKALAAGFDYPAQVLVLTAAELEEVIRRYPFHHGPEFHRYAVFTEKGAEAVLCDGSGTTESETEEFSPGTGVVYWRVLRGHTLDSSFGKHLSRAAAKVFLTNRNLNTLEKILARCRKEK